METLEPHIHAFCTPTPDVALAAAGAVDAKIAAGEDPGPLAGVPDRHQGPRRHQGHSDGDGFAAGTATSCRTRTTSASNGSRRRAPSSLARPTFRSSATAASGTIRSFPTTRNPWNLAMTSGGSSAGSGASVAAGVAPFAIGSDGGGSIRIPSAHCGLFGMKASMGRVPLYPGCRDERYPGVSSWESIEHVGPMSRTVADSALMLSVITGPDPRDRYSIPAGDVDYLEAPAEGHQGAAHRLQRGLGLRALSIPRCAASSPRRCGSSRRISAARSSAPSGLGRSVSAVLDAGRRRHRSRSACAA